MFTSSVLSILVATSVLHGTQAHDIIQDDTYFYGQSPPFYPTPEATGTGVWGDAIAKAQAFVAQLTLEEKTGLTGGMCPYPSWVS